MDINKAHRNNVNLSSVLTYLVLSLVSLSRRSLTAVAI